MRLQIIQAWNGEDELHVGSSSSSSSTGTAAHVQANFIAAALATILSGPFNYARNMQYATSSRRPALATSVILQQLWQETLSVPGTGPKLRFLQQRLRIGWGTARVALGMSMGHATYDWLRRQQQQQQQDQLITYKGEGRNIHETSDAITRRHSSHI